MGVLLPWSESEIYKWPPIGSGSTPQSGTSDSHYPHPQVSAARSITSISPARSKFRGLTSPRKALHLPQEPDHIENRPRRSIARAAQSPAPLNRPRRSIARSTNQTNRGLRNRLVFFQTARGRGSSKKVAASRANDFNSPRLRIFSTRHPVSNC